MTHRGCQGVHVRRQNVASLRPLEKSICKLLCRHSCFTYQPNKPTHLVTHATALASHMSQLTHWLQLTCRYLHTAGLCVAGHAPPGGRGRSEPHRGHDHTQGPGPCSRARLVAHERAGTQAQQAPTLLTCQGTQQVSVTDTNVLPPPPLPPRLLLGLVSASSSHNQCGRLRKHVLGPQDASCAALTVLLVPRGFFRNPDGQH